MPAAARIAPTSRPTSRGTLVAAPDSSTGVAGSALATSSVTVGARPSNSTSIAFAIDGARSERSAVIVSPSATEVIVGALPSLATASESVSAVTVSSSGVTGGGGGGVGTATTTAIGAGAAT